MKGAQLDEVKEDEAKLTTHEEVCADRYQGINARLKRLEGWFVAEIAALISFMATIIIRGLP